MAGLRHHKVGKVVKGEDVRGARGEASGRVMALDLGEARIGVALSDEMRMFATPLCQLDRRKDVFAALEALVRRYGVTEVVVGLPLNMNGTAGPAARAASEFAEALRARLHLPVATFDERLTTVAAERALLEADLSRARRRELRDKVSAALILQAYLARRESGSR